jgi:hypothetical protein
MADSYWEHNGHKLKRIDLGDGTYAQAFGLLPGLGDSAPIRAHTSAPTVDTGAAYGPEDLVGGLQTFPDVAAAGGSGILRGVLVGDRAKNAADNSKYNLVFFGEEPTLTTFTERDPLAVHDDDLLKIAAVVFFDASQGVGRQCNFAASAVFYGETASPFQLDGTDLYLAMVVEGEAGPTFAAATDLFVRLFIERV